MQLLLCAATPFEIGPVTDQIARNGWKNVEILITGIGLTAATYSITRAVLTRRPQFILQAGIAGTLNDALPLTKIVLVENEIIGDLGVQQEGRFQSIFDLNLQKENEFPFTSRKLHNELSFLHASGMTIVDAVTVNEISTDRERIEYYKETGASIESMEGAALHYVGIREKIPFLQLRSLSNFAGERNKSRWMMKEAIASLNHELERIISKLSNQ